MAKNIHHVTHKHKQKNVTVPYSTNEFKYVLSCEVKKTTWQRRLREKRNANHKNLQNRYINIANLDEGMH